MFNDVGGMFNHDRSNAGTVVNGGAPTTGNTGTLTNNGTWNGAISNAGTGGALKQANSPRSGRGYV
jgi:hypothetical protein